MHMISLEKDIEFPQVNCSFDGIWYFLALANFVTNISLKINHISHDISLNKFKASIYETKRKNTRLFGENQSKFLDFGTVYFNTGFTNFGSKFYFYPK